MKVAVGLKRSASQRQDGTGSGPVSRHPSVQVARQPSVDPRQSGHANTLASARSVKVDGKSKLGQMVGQPGTRAVDALLARLLIINRGSGNNDDDSDSDDDDWHTDT